MYAKVNSLSLLSVVIAMIYSEEIGIVNDIVELRLQVQVNVNGSCHIKVHSEDQD